MQLIKRLVTIRLPKTTTKWKSRLLPLLKMLLMFLLSVTLWTAPLKLGFRLRVVTRKMRLIPVLQIKAWKLCERIRTGKDLIHPAPIPIKRNRTSKTKKLRKRKKVLLWSRISKIKSLATWQSPQKSKNRTISRKKLTVAPSIRLWILKIALKLQELHGINSKISLSLDSAWSVRENQKEHQYQDNCL